MRSLLLLLALVAACAPAATPKSKAPAKPDGGGIVFGPPDGASLAEVAAPPDVVEVPDLGIDEVVEVAAPPDEADEDAATPPDDDPGPPPDACIADCAGKDCGDNGCGGLCGFCVAGLACNNLYKCAPDCTPSCDGKFCGPDGCGGTCGSCLPSFECGSDGKCYDVTCTPDCTGKACGDDGCGGECGSCVNNDLCVEGACVTGPCSGIPLEGVCDGDTSLLCVEGAKAADDCAAKAQVCGWSPEVGHYACVAPVVCTPVCGGKQCGSDGCGGECGTCPSGWPCATGVCTPTAGGGCGYFNAKGKCIEGKLYYCSNAVLYTQDCPALGLTCGFDTTKQANACK